MLHMLMLTRALATSAATRCHLEAAPLPPRGHRCRAHMGTSIQWPEIMQRMQRRIVPPFFHCRPL